ncbi:MAG: hypothetical protein HN904_20425 [Victivallales bacterium]|nr:hypothetical protein [Victivallales bacterium]
MRCILLSLTASLLLSLPGGAAPEARERSVDPMTATTHWQLGGRRINYVLGQSAVSVSQEQARPGSTASLKLAYDFREPRRDYLSAYWTGDPLPGRCESVSFWLFGDGLGRPLSLAIEDANGRWYQRTVGLVDWEGWQQVTVPVGAGQDWRALRRRGEAEQALVHPVWMRQIALGRGTATVLQGAVYLSDLCAVTVADPMDFVVGTITTDQPGNRLRRGVETTLNLALVNHGDAAAQGTAALSVTDFFGSREDLVAQAVSLAPGQTATLAFPYQPARVGACTVTAILGTGEQRRALFKPIAVVDPSGPPTGNALGTFGCHASIGGFREDQMDTIFALNQDAGIRWERLSFNWRTLEPSPGVFIWNPPPTVPGAKGLAVRGPTGLTTAPDDHLNLRDGVTVAFWLQAEKKPGNWQWPLLKYADSPNRNYGVFLNKDTGVASFTAAFERGNRSYAFGVSSGWSPWDGKWHHFAATYSAESGAVIIYVDGREIKRELVNGGRLRTGPDGVRLGSNYEGALDEVVICDRALAADQIAALAARRAPPAEGLVARWSFDDPQNPGRDSGPHGLHAAAARNERLTKLSERARTNGMRIVGILGFPPVWASTAPVGTERPWVYKPDLTAWGRSVEATTRQFAGLVDHWEIWNEPNISVFWEPRPNAADFLDVVRVGYAAAKRGNPACTVITPGLAGAGERGEDFLGNLIRGGAVPFCDAISIHPYRQTTPEGSDLVGDIQRISDLCEENGGRRHLWITEWCWTTQIGGGSSEERSAIMTGRGIPLALGTGLVDRIIWFRLADPGTDRFYSEHNYGLCHNDLTPKPAYFAFRTCARLLDGARPGPDVALGAGLWARQFQRGDEVILAVWAPDGPAMVALATDLRQVGVVDLMGNERKLPTEDGVLFLGVSEAVQFVRLRRPLTTGVTPVELLVPAKIAMDEAAELRLRLRNPLARAVDVAVEMAAPVERTFTATVAAHGTHEVPVLLGAIAALGPGLHRLLMTVRYGDLSWSQSAGLMVTSVRPGDALAGYWSFDEGQGKVARDATPNANHGTVTGCRWVPGRKGMALAFGGSSAEAVGGPAVAGGEPDLVVVPDAPALDLPEEVTVAFWLKLTGDTGSWQFPVTKFRSNLARNYGMYVCPGTFVPAFSTSFVDAAAPHSDASGGPALNDGQWHHLAATYALATGRVVVYVDGRQTGALVGAPRLLKTVDEPLRMGAGTRGVIDEVRVYGRALSAAEAAQLAREP